MLYTPTQERRYFYHSFEFKEWINTTALLSQIRLFDAKRLHYRVGMINKDDFELVKGKLKTLLEVTPSKQGERIIAIYENFIAQKIENVGRLNNDKYKSFSHF